jgi:hypothetical protein
MKSTKDPMCGDAGCFAGLISIVAEYIPELKAAYDYNSPKSPELTGLMVGLVFV